MTTQRRTRNAGNRRMWDAEGNLYVVNMTVEEIRATYDEGTESGWAIDRRRLSCREGPVNDLGDGSFQVLSSGTRIYPKSRLPGAEPPEQPAD